MSEYLTFLITVLFDNPRGGPYEQQRYALELRPADHGPDQDVRDAFEYYMEASSQKLMRSIIDKTNMICAADSYCIQEVEQILGCAVLKADNPSRLRGMTEVGTVIDTGPFPEPITCPSPPCGEADIRYDEKTKMNVCNDCGCGWS